MHFGAAGSTLDLDTRAVDAAQVVEAERRANQIVVENRSVEVSFEGADAATGLRKASDRGGTLRIVTIDRLDRSACGGTHVRATGEIGVILLRKVEHVRQQTRLEFVCGGRAVRRARADQELLARMSQTASAGPDELPALLEQQRGDLARVSAERKQMEERLAGYRARELYDAAAAGPGGRRVVIVHEDRGVMESLRLLGQAVARFPGGVFFGTVAEPPALLLATSADSGVDAARTLRPILEAHGGRGGGNARLAQGTAPIQETAAAMAGALSA